MSKHTNGACAGESDSYMKDVSSVGCSSVSCTNGTGAELAWPHELYAQAERVINLLLTTHTTVSTAESCTAGLVTSALTEISGSSAAVCGGCASYTPQVKHAVLGVSQPLLDNPALGPVSSFCALQMARGAQSLFGSTYSVSVTGIAGPTGALPHRPIGTVWFCIMGTRGFSCICKHFEGNRNAVRTQAVSYALLLIEHAIQSAL